MDISRYWKIIVNTLREALLVVDTGGKIIAVNPSAEKLTGYSAGEMVGQSCRILGCTGCKIKGEGLGVHWCGLYAKGEVQAKRCLITTKDGRAVHVIKNAAVLRDNDGNNIGAVETLTDMSEIVRQQEEIAALRRSCQFQGGHYGIIGEAPPMQQLFELIDSVALSEAPVLIQGRSGTGKELIARAIHEAGPRKDKPFIKVNCAALNENLLESELFGHVRGAYTGADKTRIGRFEAAHGGTLLLDEIGDIPPATQVKLLRVLEEKEIERVGDHRPIPVDVRIITATNKNLEDLVSKEIFREDLFFRINVFPIHAPALAERREDIPLIVQNFIDRNGHASGRKILGLTSEAMETLMAYAWPGNVRELRNAVEYAFVLCPAQWIGVEHLPPKITRNESIHSASPALPSPEQKEKDRLIRTLRQTGGNQSETARRLNVSRVTIWKRIKKHGIDLDTVLSD